MENKKTAVVYYTLQGYTEKLAYKIAEITNADLYKIELVKPYTILSSYTLGILHARRGVCPEIKNKIQNLDSYDTIFIGAPVWAFMLTPPINTFLKENNLDMKNVVPFCTHKGNFGSYFKNFKEKLPNSIISKYADFHNNTIVNEERVKEFIKESFDLK